MPLENPWPAVLVIINELGHVALSIAHVGEPFRTFSDRVSFRPGLESSGFLFKNIIEKLLCSVRSVDFLRRFQEIESKLVTVSLKKIMAASCQPINHLRSAHLLRPTPGVQVAVALESQTMLLD